MVPVFKELITNYFNPDCPLIEVKASGNTGVTITIDNPYEMGADRIVDALAAAVDLAGVEHVGFGTDNSGFGATPAVWDDYRDFPLIVRLMRKRGFSPEDIRKIAGGNYLRVFNRSVKAA